ncbi:prenyl protein peptidase [Angomonas deanei]|nr:prenyl protein peptidase [Angomonas deanei]|eukprot:EPY32267.1 prenyl protein peptidase [Angomonas deanei]
MGDFTRGALLCTGFVLSFYMWPSQRRFVRQLLFHPKGNVPSIDRDDPTIVKQRMISFTVACALGELWKRCVLPPVSAAPSGTTVVQHLCVCFFSTVALFAGPLYEFLSGKAPTPTCTVDVYFVRDVVLAPLGEELFFRGVILQQFQGRSERVAIALSAILFALSHSHHLFTTVGAALDDEKAGETSDITDDAVRRCWMEGLHDLTRVYAITFVFGLVSGLYYTRLCGGSVLPIAATHSLCNVLGPPPLTFLGKSEKSSGRCVTVLVYAVGIATWCGLMVKFARSP